MVKRGRIYTFIVLMLLTMVVGVGKATSEAKFDWVQDRKMLQSHFNKRDCANFWKVIWPWVQRDKVEAQSLLIGAMVEYGLTPPGDKKRDAHIFALSIRLIENGAENHDIVDELIDWISKKEKQQLVKLKSCFVSTKSVKLCINQAVNAEVIDSFPQYMKDVNSAIGLGKFTKCEYIENY